MVEVHGRRRTLIENHVQKHCPCPACDQDLPGSPLPLATVIRGEPDRAPNLGETYGKFAVPMYVCVYVAIHRPRDHHAAHMRIAQSITPALCHSK